MLFPALRSSPPDAGVVFLPSDRFFWRVVPLVPDQDAAAQAELAVESLGPFPTAQLYWGFLASPARDQAVIYAAHRRRFDAAETDAWRDAELIVPGLLALCGQPATADEVVVHADGHRLAGLARAARAALPAAVLAREFAEPPTEEQRRAFATELGTRAGLTGVTPRFLTGDLSATRSGDTIAFQLHTANGAEAASAEFSETTRDELDVRDRALLAGLRAERSRSLLLWRVGLGGAALAGLALFFELLTGGLRLYNRSLGAEIAARQPEVQRLEAANTLSSRIEDLTIQQLRPFEMLVLVNEVRPPSVQFQRVVARDRATIEIEAQTNNSGAMDAFVTALRNLPHVTRFEPRPQQTRDGVISISLTVVFEPAALREKGGAS